MEELSFLVGRAREGEVDAFNEIVCRFQDMAVGYSLSILRDVHLAEDAAQDAFLQAYVDLKELNDVAAFPGWFRRIVFKQCDRIKRKRHWFAVPLDEGQTSEPEVDVDKLVDEQKYRERLEKAIRSLPRPEQAVFTLFYMSNFTQKEIARFLEVPPTTINNRLHEARRRLRSELIQMATENLHEQRPSRDSAFSDRVGGHLDALASFHDRLISPLTKLFSQVLDKDATTAISSVNHTIAVEVVQNFSNPCCTYTFIPASGQERIFIEIDMALVSALVGRDPALGDHMLAADLEHVTEQEMNVLHSIAKRLIEAVIGIWTGVLSIEMNEAELETGPVALVANPKYKTVDPEEPVFHVLLDVKWKNQSRPINLCYPAATLAAAVEQLSAARTAQIPLTSE